MAELHHFSYGWVTPVLAYVMSALGCLLGFLIARKARRRAGAPRARLLAYASVAFGATGIWLAQTIALLGFSVAETTVAFDPVALGVGLAVAVLDIGTGLFIAGFGQRRWWRLMAAGVVIAMGTTATQYVTMSAIRVNGVIRYESNGLFVTMAVAVVVAAAALWFTTSLRRPRVNVVAAAVMAGALTAMHYVGEYSMEVYLGPSGAAVVAGIASVMLLVSVVVFGTTALALPGVLQRGNVPGMSCAPSTTTPAPTNSTPPSSTRSPRASRSAWPPRRLKRPAPSVPTPSGPGRPELRPSMRALLTLNGPKRVQSKRTRSQRSGAGRPGRRP